MDTQVRTPQAVFMQPQRLLVPMFQRPYVWNEELQWDPLWKDLVRVADRLLAKPEGAQLPHFLGAVVLQQMQSQTGALQQRTVIDGQQRLTTLQLLLDALHAELAVVGASQPAARLKSLIANDEAFRTHPEDRFKVWPTNRDRDAFNEVMAAPTPVDYSKLTHRSSKLAKAHQFFAAQARSWLMAYGAENAALRAEALERSARDLLQIVVIDLTASENAQEIFETLNARGAVLTAADLIKNFVFQRLLEQGTDVEKAYQQYWVQFETAFWEKEVNVGRILYPRSSVFLNHWLIARTGGEVVAREVFSKFKTYADFESGLPMLELLREIHRAAGVYKSFTEQADALEGALDRVGIFSYRMKSIESEVIRPVLLALLDRPTDPLPDAERDKALVIIESWIVRRMLVRATNKAYNSIMASVVGLIRETKADKVALAIEQYFASQSADSSYWPDDDEIRREISNLPIYRKLSRGRLRMALEAIEDDFRGWRPGQKSASGVRIRRATYAIEHVMPQSWQKHWPLSDGVSEADRDARIHRLGNLTLLTAKLNGKVSHGPWLGNKGKVDQLQSDDVLLLNSRLLKEHALNWDEEAIDSRTTQAIAALLSVWPVPSGHKVVVAQKASQPAPSVDIADLISSDLLAAGQMLHSRKGKYQGHTATVLSDGRLEIAGIAFNSPSLAATSIVGKPTNGWYFWCTEPASTHDLRELRSEHWESFSADAGSLDDEQAG